MRIDAVLPVVSQCVSLVSHFVNLFWRCVCAFEFSFIILVFVLVSELHF